MSRKGLWIAAAVVIVSNAYTLGSARLNRAGEPEAVLDLTERELRLSPREADNTAIALELWWSDLAPTSPDADAPGWFDAAKLASVGFDCRLPATQENASHYREMPARTAYAVLENDGDAWRRYWDGLATDADRELAARRSRLVVIDVGLDPIALRARYPDRRRTAIVPASVGIGLPQARNGKPFLKGRVNFLYSSVLNVERELRPALESLLPRTVSVADRRTGLVDPVGEPRYRATVKWGRLREPWIAGVERMK
jgi:hypothetical protein